MVLFLILSLGALIVVTLAVEWMVDLLFIHSKHGHFPYNARWQGTQAEVRARQQAEFDEICEDLGWQQLTIARGWPVSARLAKRAFTVVAASAVLLGQAQDDPPVGQVQTPSANPED